MSSVGLIGAFQFSSKLQSVRLYQSTGGLHIFVLAAEIIYMLFILYYMFLQVNPNKSGTAALIDCSVLYHPCICLNSDI